MILSREKLLAESSATGFRPDVVEKAVQLLGLLEALQGHPFLKGRVALKGGTALNLFLFDLPRLSVDVDINYIGSEDRDVMLAERPKIEEAVGAVLKREGFQVRRMPQEHAGGKWRLTFPSALGEEGSLELDINFMLRTPLWPVALRDSRTLGWYHAAGIPVVDDIELAGGKLSALLSRHASRDLFDAHHFLTRVRFDGRRLRLAFVVYGGINRRDWRTVKVEDVAFDTREIRQRLIPLLREEAVKRIEPLKEWGERLLENAGSVSGPSSPSKPTRGSSSTACLTTATSSHPCSPRSPSWPAASGAAATTDHAAIRNADPGGNGGRGGNRRRHDRQVREEQRPRLGGHKVGH